jgi:hypothetical protein
MIKPITPGDLYSAKAERRVRLAALPFDEKVRIMEKLQTMGHTLRAARGQLRPLSPASRLHGPSWRT